MVTTDACGAIGAMVIDSDNGFVIKPGDIQALSEAMKQLLNGTLRDNMGRRSLEIVNAFCNTEMETEGYVETFQRVLRTDTKNGRLN